MKRRIIIFISGAYTGNTKEETAENIRIAKLYSCLLWGIGYTVICPHLNTAHFDTDCICGYKDYISGDLEMMKRCDVLFQLPNWDYSRGARIEFFIAERRGIPIFESIIRLEEWYAESIKDKRI